MPPTVSSAVPETEGLQTVIQAVAEAPVVTCSVSTQPRWTAAARAFATMVLSSTRDERTFVFCAEVESFGNAIAVMSAMMIRTMRTSAIVNPALRIRLPPLGTSYYR